MEIEQEQILVSELPTDLVLQNLLPKISWPDVGSAACVNRAWRSAMKSASPFSRIPLHRPAPAIKISADGACLSIFDPETEQEHFLPPNPALEGGFPQSSGFAYGNGVLYILGGRDPSTGRFLSTVYALNLAHGSKTWAQCPSMTSPRVGFACLMVEDKIYVAGGEEEDCLALATLDVYDVKHRRWESLVDMPSPHSRCIAALHHDYLCILVGLAEEQDFLVEHVHKLKYGCRAWKSEVATKSLLDNCILQLGVSSVELMNRDSLFQGSHSRRKSLAPYWS